MHMSYRVRYPRFFDMRPRIWRLELIAGMSLSKESRSVKYVKALCSLNITVWELLNKAWLDLVYEARLNPNLNSIIK